MCDKIASTKNNSVTNEVPKSTGDGACRMKKNAKKQTRFSVIFYRKNRGKNKPIRKTNYMVQKNFKFPR